MLRTQLLAAARAARRILPLGLAAVLLTSTLRVPAPALADDSLGPVARIVVIVREMYIIDDHDPGDGELTFKFKLTCVATPSPCLGQPTADLDTYIRRLSASSRQTVVLNQGLPASEPTNPQYDASADTGYPMYPGQSYEIRFGMSEDDFIGDDHLGSRTLLLTQEYGWGIGTHDLYTVLPDRLGDWKLKVEIREARLPDLHPYNITIDDLPGTTRKRVCMAVANRGNVTAGPFEVALRVDGLLIEAARAAGLLVQESTERCVETGLPISGTHKLVAVVDEPHALTEYDETNNFYEQAYTGTPPQAPTSPQTGAAPGAAQADLVIGSIKVNGQVTDGKNDCKDGKNAVTVVVKNVGAADAKDVSVRLIVDDAQGAAVEQTVKSLDAGQEREVRFEGVRLKKGEHTLAATTDPKSTVAESDDDNNALTVTAGCSAA
jgi:hypothetical protein